MIWCAAWSWGALCLSRDGWMSRGWVGWKLGSKGCFTYLEPFDDPRFDWKGPCFGGPWPSKIEVIHRFQVLIDGFFVGVVTHPLIRSPLILTNPSRDIHFCLHKYSKYLLRRCLGSKHRSWRGIWKGFLVANDFLKGLKSTWWAPSS